MRRLILENIWWKLASLALSVALWLTIINEPELVTSAAVPIFYKGLPRGIEIASDQPDKIFLEIRGPASRLTPGRLADTAVQLDLTDVTKPGERTFTVSRTNINLPAGVTFLRAVPSQLRLAFDHQVSKDVEVRLRLSGKPADGWRVANQKVTPERLRIVGPASRVALIDEAETDPVDLTGFEDLLVARVHSYIADSQVRFESSPMVQVRVELARTTGAIQNNK
jgi:YbbR domain-containing protein